MLIIKVMVMLFVLSVVLKANTKEYVVLLHGLSRTAKSMEKLAETLNKDYQVLNIDYKSRKNTIEDISKKEIDPQIQRFCTDPELKINFVTHSMGGIILRHYLNRKKDSLKVGRIVMLSPPNKGSEVVDNLMNIKFVTKINGPAFRQLSTDSLSFVNMLPPPRWETGIITGNQSINWINSIMIPGPDDGKVSVESAKLEGMKDFLVVKRTHPMIMKAPEVIDQTLHFFKQGKFKTAKQ